MNIFDGQSGRSDGAGDGYSQEITGEGNTVNIFVSGTFSGASVTIQKFVYADDDFEDTAATWTRSDIFQGLSVRPGDRFRLIISNASSGTDIVAEVS